MRTLKFTPSFLPHAEGSCLVQMGNTKVLCVATIEEKVPPHAEKAGTGWVTAEYAMLPRAGRDRSRRDKAMSGGRAQEISRLVGRSLRAAVDLRKIGPRTIIVDCDVIQADGGTRTASINGGFVALAQAFSYLKKKKWVSEGPIKTHVAAVSLGIFQNNISSDMCYEEDARADADINIVMDENGGLIEIQGTAEHRPFEQSQLNRLINLGKKDIQKIILAQKKCLKKI